MNNLIPFTFGSQKLRVIEREQAPWFVAADVAEILGYSESAAMVRSLDDDEAILQTVQGRSQNRQMTIISESGLYNAIFRSRRAEAKAFRRWITGTVLPEIRRTGSYQGIGLHLSTVEDRLNGFLADRQSVTINQCCAALDVDRRTASHIAALLRLSGWQRAWVRRNALGEAK